MTYGLCPACGKDAGTARERRPNGRTFCGECSAWTKSRLWKLPEWKEAVVILVLRTDDAVAAVRRGPGDWNLPGGKVEPGETTMEAAKRELFEETGLRCELQDTGEHTLDNGRPVHIFLGRERYTMGFVLVDSPEGIAEWMTWAQVTFGATFEATNGAAIRELIKLRGDGMAVVGCAARGAQVAADLIAAGFLRRFR